jgi:heptosyltransferase I
LANPPDSICILRLSALGDVSHVVPIVRTLQQQWPGTKITWIVGRLEHALVEKIAGVNFIVFDKSLGWSAYRAVWRQLHDQRFDVLLHMQKALRTSLLSMGIHADVKIGFDRKRAGDLQWLFSNRKIAARKNQHVLDSFFGFIEALGVDAKHLEWNIPIDADAVAFALEQMGEVPTLVINPCASARARNFRSWRASGYARVADYANRTHGLNVLITGSPADDEVAMGRAITEICRSKVVNLTGKTTIQQLLAILDRARVVIAPDTGPAHLASAMGTPVIGLYVTTNPDRARPYCSPEWVVNRYPQAVAQYLGKSVAQVPWGTRVRKPNAVDLIEDADVIEMLDRVMRAG